MSFSLSEYAKAGWFQEGRFAAGGEGRTRGGGKRGREKTWGMGKGGEKGEVGGLATWLMGDRPHVLSSLYQGKLAKYTLTTTDQH